jgi:3-oxoacyl-[acyl-carrier protein] reductase
MMSEPRVILITGASRGIGKALAIAAAREGHHVVINYRKSADQAEALAEELRRGSRQAIALQADVGIAGDVDRLIGATIEHFGRLDCVVNNAGVGETIAIEALDEVVFSQTLHANLTSAFLVSQAAWPHMTERGGRLVFLSSGAARTGGVLSAAYAASKGGIESLMHYYATYLRRHRITANAIAPSLIETDMARAMTLPPSNELPLGRLGRADEIWPALRMILETEYITGQTIHVDAGRYMT